MMGKQAGKKNLQMGKSGDPGVNSPKASKSPRGYDMDTVVFISMAQGHKEDGNIMFQKRDYEGAILKYEKAINLLPKNHIDISYLHTNIAACYMQMGLSDYPRAIHECNLALEVTPKYSKALLKRARCYEELNRIELAYRDVTTVLAMEPNNSMALETAERVKKTMERRGIVYNTSLEQVEMPATASRLVNSLKEKAQKKKSFKTEKEVIEKTEDMSAENDGKGIHVEKKDDDLVGGKKDEGKVEEKMDDDEVEEKTDGEQIEKDIEVMTPRKSFKEMVQKKKSIKMSKNIIEKTEDEAEMKGETEIRTEIKEKVKGRMEIKERTVLRAEGKNLNVGEFDRKKVDEYMEKNDEKKAEDKLVVEEKRSINCLEDEPKRTVKFVLGEDIRWGKIPIKCSVMKLREIVSDRYPRTKSVLVKYRDQEGDMITITTDEELRWAEESCDKLGSLKLYIVEVGPEQDPLFEKVRSEKQRNRTSQSCIDDWIVEFAQLFKNYVGFNSDTCMDLHELGMKLFTEAMEDTTTGEEAQNLFNAAGDKFQEMAALALFNLGNVHMSKARKRVYYSEDGSRESILKQVQVAYDWAQKEYSKATKAYEEALEIKPDFYESVLALGQQQFEQAKLAWYYAVGTNVDFETWDSTEVLRLYNMAEDNMEKGMQMWETSEKQRMYEIVKPSKVKNQTHKMELNKKLNDTTTEEATEQAANMRSLINLLWGTMLYERSIMEYKLGLPVWHECLEVSVEKFELAGASQTDIAVMIKNHCSNDSALEGLGFNIDEIVQAWNEMYEAKKWQSRVPTFRLEPLLRRRVSRLYHALNLHESY